MTVRPGRSAGMDGAGSAGETRSLNRHSAQRGSRLWLVASRRPTRLSPRREVAPLGSLTTTALAQPSSSFCRGSRCGPLWGGASSCVRRGSVASSRWTTASMAPPVASVGDLHRHAGLPGLVLVGVVQVRARRGRRVLAGHEGHEIDGHRLGLGEGDDAALAQILELPRLEGEAAGEADGAVVYGRSGRAGPRHLPGRRQPLWRILEHGRIGWAAVSATSSRSSSNAC